MQLSQKQLQIVNHKDGALLVEAGPGSGKTRVLIERIKRLLSSSKRGKVLALTFSNLAADEMKDRLSEDRAFEEQLDRVTAGTIHSFCLDLVQSRGNLIGLNSDMVLFESEDDRKTVLKDVFLENQQLKDFLAKQQDKNQIMQRILQLISEQKKRFVLPENCNINAPFPLICCRHKSKKTMLYDISGEKTYALGRYKNSISFQIYQGNCYREIYLNGLNVVATLWQQKIK